MKSKYRKIKILSVFGTRPEAIKMCPLVKEMERCEYIDSVVCLTGQHREMLQQVIDIFDIQVKYNLDIMIPNQTLTSITMRILEGLEYILKDENPDLILVHGDTTTSFASALAAFYQKISVGHVEAGLRTYDKYSPYPEEINRTLTGRLAELHFCPTTENAKALQEEGITKNVFITGNTVIDALKATVQKNYVFRNSQLLKLSLGIEKTKTILITAHRRENIGKGIENICNAIKSLSSKHKEYLFIYPVHPNPNIKKVVEKLLKGIDNVRLIEPLDVTDMHNLMVRCYLIMTDSGGIQEEAPSFGVPVVVLRNETERREAVEAGTVILAGTEYEAIVECVSKLMNNSELYLRMIKAKNPYGDGNASTRIIENIMQCIERQGE